MPIMLVMGVGWKPKNQEFTVHSKSEVSLGFMRPV